MSLSAHSGAPQWEPSWNTFRYKKFTLMLRRKCIQAVVREELEIHRAKCKKQSRKVLSGIWPPQRSRGKILPGTCAHHWKRKTCLGEVITWVDRGQCREGRVQCTERPLELVDRSGGEATGVATLPTVQTCSFGTALYETTPEDKLIPTQSRRFFLRMVVRGRW